jgi:membrane protein implicated in regulation of membrane protease activity
MREWINVSLEFVAPCAEENTLTMEWWYWVVAGIILTLMELVVPSFFILWFGLGAVLVGLLLLVAPEFPLTGQILLWTIASVTMTVLWFRFFQPPPE